MWDLELELVWPDEIKPGASPQGSGGSADPQPRPGPFCKFNLGILLFLTTRDLGMDVANLGIFGAWSWEFSKK